MTRRQFSFLSFSTQGGLFSGRAIDLNPFAPARRFVLQFQCDDFQVPEDAMWRLAWCSPYKPGDLTPGYDVRIIEGQARLGARGEMIARACDPRLGTPGLLDLQATALHALITGPTVVVWLEAGTRFTLANERVEVRVEEYQN